MGFRPLLVPAPPRRWSAPGARGWAWVEVAAALDADLRRWLAAGVFTEGEPAEIHKSGVFRLGELVVKPFRPDRSAFRSLRPSPAVRAARETERALREVAEELEGQASSSGL
jgi:hypothetical protein